MAENPPDLEEPIRPSGDPEGVPLELRRMRNEGKPPVLLLHGASAQHATFCIPKGRSLAEFLWKNDYEPWLLDWRGSRRVTDALGDRGLDQMRDVLDLDRAASEDVPWALRTIAEARDAEDFSERHKIHVVAHCLGAAVLAQMIAAGDPSVSDRLGRIVLLTIGLFYEPPLDGKIKGQFNVLDRLWNEGSVTLIDPRKPERENRWPLALRRVYEGIGSVLRPHPQADVEPLCSHALCNRVSFMYGAPFRHSNLVGEIHGWSTVRFQKGEAQPGPGERLHTAFVAEEPPGDEAGVGGPAPLLAEPSLPRSSIGFVRDVKLESGSWRRGDAAGTFELVGSVGKFPADALLGNTKLGHYELRANDQTIATCQGKPHPDRPAELGKQFGGIPLRMYLQGALNVRRRWAAKFPSDRSAKLQSDNTLINRDARERFHRLPAVTLITGEHNQLWHRDSINRMHEWVTAGLTGKTRERFTKEIIPDYGHQDLLWGESAEKDVFPIILGKGLGGDDTIILVDDDPSGPTPGPTSNA